MRGGTKVFSSETVDDLKNAQFFFLENALQVSDVNRNKIEHRAVSFKSIRHFYGKNTTWILWF